MRYLLLAFMVLLAGCCGNDVHQQIRNYLEPLGYTYVKPPNDFDAPGSLFDAQKERLAVAGELGVASAIRPGETALPEYTGGDAYSVGLDSLSVVIPNLPSPASASAALSVGSASRVSIKLANPKIMYITPLGYKRAFAKYVSKGDLNDIRSLSEGKELYYVSEAVEVKGMECSFYSASNQKLSVSASATLGTVQIAPGVSAQHNGTDSFTFNFEKPLYIGYKLKKFTPMIEVGAAEPGPPPSGAPKSDRHATSSMPKSSPKAIKPMAPPTVVPMPAPRPAVVFNGDDSEAIVVTKSNDVVRIRF